MEKTGQSGGSRGRLARGLAFGAVCLVMAAFLAAPAALYWWKFPDLTNLLSLVVSVSFFLGLVILIRPLVLILALAIPVLVMNLIDIVHLLAFGGLVSLGALESVFFVNPAEAVEFVASHALPVGGGVLLVVFFLGLAIARTRLDQYRFREKLLVAVVAVTVPSTVLAASLALAGSKRDVFLPTRLVEHLAASLGVNPLTHTLSGLATVLGERRELSELAAIRNRHVFGARLAPGRPQGETHIIVIGESSRSANWSLYGYPRPTNPRLSGLDGLFVFRDATSPASTTSRSLPLSFSFATPADPDRFFQTRSLVSAFREAGYRTWWISNQGTHRNAVGNQLALIMGEAETVVTTNYGFWNTVLDGEMLPELDRALRDPAPRKLIILHTLGSHTNYPQRYPADWTLGEPDVPVREAHAYKGIGDAQAEVIDQYDRTISYTDWMLSEVIRRHAATGMHGSVLYFSDHGQRLYDDKQMRKGHGFRGFRKADGQIPLLAWLPAVTRAASPQRVRAIGANALKPVTTGDLATSMLDLAGIDVPGLDRERSFFSPAYEPHDRPFLTTDGKIEHY
ncbi:phosphoethanolamine transferase [Zhengella sp. ZM62]|uniref:phosphoethanolamine transferase n=1 Tax=Zhengella sedimenti TaxID=3390035 RepID=UPI0039767087